MDDSTHAYLIRCGCGDELRVGTGQAGATVDCPRCGAEIRLPKLSQLRQSPIVAGLVEARRPWQFSLGALFVFVTFAALFIVFGKAVGFHWFFFAIPVCTAIGLLGAVLPRPVVYGIVLGSVFLLIGTLTVCSVAQTQELSRQLQTSNNLREVGPRSGPGSQVLPGH
ncbi:MAG TPA: hypothetical protein VG125_07600 [Pirellulales bacterium]|jgi:hypothetical protein|nr:hypothetical protein [Pirellulales bacterium]